MFMRKLCRYVALAAYYAIGYFLPSSSMGYIGRISKQIRYSLCKRLFASIGEKCNIQRRAYFGTGFDISMGNFSGLGKNLKVHNTVLHLGDYVMMGPDIMIMGGDINLKTRQYP